MPTTIERLTNSSIGVTLKSLFTRNIPENILDISQVVMNLKGILSDETIIGHHPCVSDVEDEMARIEKENEGKIDLSSYLDDLREPEQDTAPIGEDQV